MVRTMTSALSVWKSQVHTAPAPTRNACSRPLGADGSATAGSEVTWQTVRESRSVRKSLSGWR